MSIQEREKQFFDKAWQEIEIRKVSGKITIPGIKNFKDKRVLICSCGLGVAPVQAAKQGAKTYAFDISETAVNNTIAMAKYNNVELKADVMDFHNLSYEDNFFDVVYGRAILHHVDCSVVANEIYRVLKPGGIAFFRDTSDKNPILRFIRRRLFGKPGEFQKQKLLFVKRTGTTDEYPLTDEEIERFSKTFNGNIRIYNEVFYFFQLLNVLIFRNRILGNLLTTLDSLIGCLFPFIKKYSFGQEIWLIKKD